MHLLLGACCLPRPFARLLATTHVQYISTFLPLSCDCVSIEVLGNSHPHLEDR